MSLSDRMEERLRRGAARGAGARWARLESTAAVALISRHEREVPFWPLDRVRELQRRRLRAVLRHAHATVPFYRTALDERGLRPESFDSDSDLGQLPEIDGAALTEDPMRFVSEPFRTRGREVWKTSGSSSGLRKPIFWDHASIVLHAARVERDRVVLCRLAGEPWSQVIVREFLTNELKHTLARWVGVETAGHQRLLILPADFSNRTQRTIYHERTVIPRRAVHYHHLSPAVPFEVAAAHLEALRPRVVFSFGSYVDQFFHFLDASARNVPLPRVWVYLGDRVSPGGRELAESLGCALYSVYSAVEAGTIGFQCERREGFHLNIDLCSVRIVGDDGAEVPAGELGDIVISPLVNRAMALLNYRIGDRGALAREPCPCGRSLPLLERLEGRRSEIVQLADGRELSSVTIEAAFSSELRQTLQAQLQQLAPGRLRIRVVPFAGADRTALREALAARGRYALGAGTELDVEFLDQIPRTSAGKFARVLTPPAPGTEKPDGL